MSRDDVERKASTVRPGKLPYAKRKALSARASLSREDRAMIRIMYLSGASQAEVAARLGCSSRTVRRVINRQARAAFDGDSSDFDHVDDDFRKEFPNIKPKTEGPRLQNNRNATTESLSATVRERDEKPPISSKSTPDSQNAPEPGISASSSSAMRSVVVKKEILEESSKEPGSTLQCAITIEDDPTPEATPEHTPEPTLEPKSDLYVFLKDLEHDLSGFTDALTKQQLGTTEKLFAIAGWPEERLHRVLIESIPDLPVPQRFMLVLGIKKAAGLVGSD